MLKNKIKKIYYKYLELNKSIRKIIYHKLFRLRLRNKDFVIISNNCWGGDIYQALNLPYNTPFIGLYINAPCFIKILKQPKKYLLQTSLEFKSESKYNNTNDKKYPIGKLNDVEIHFLHYKSNEEAQIKWHRRLSRLSWNKENWFIKFDDRDNCTINEIISFHNLPYKNKISITKEKFYFENNVQLKKPSDLILLHTTYSLFDFVKWLDQCKVGNSGINKFLTSLIKYPSKF